jgi:ankyrin repeat protein
MKVPIYFAAFLLSSACACVSGCATVKTVPPVPAGENPPPGVDAALWKTVDALVAKLGNDNYHVREAAQKEIEALPASSLAAVMASVGRRSKDAEIKMRGGWAFKVLEYKAADPLRAAIAAKDADRMSLLIKLGAPVDADIEFEEFEKSEALPTFVEEIENKRKGKPLHWAAWYCNRDTAELLLAHGADVGAKDNAGMTALHWAARGGHTDTVKLLLDHGADVNDKANDGDTALHEAAGNGSKDTVELLLAHGAKVDAKRDDDRTALHGATVLRHKDVVELLLAHGADVNAKDKYGQTALRLAVWMGLQDGQKDIVKLLLAHGADVNAKDNYGQTALQSAAWTNNAIDNVELLMAHGADVNTKDNDGMTALNTAAHHKEEDKARFLLEHGADPAIKNNGGQSPIDVWPALADIVKQVEAKKAAKGRKP